MIEEPKVKDVVTVVNESRKAWFKKTGIVVKVATYMGLPYLGVTFIKPNAPNPNDRTHVVWFYDSELVRAT